MSRPLKTVVDCLTGETITTELTDEEMAEREARIAEAAADAAAREKAEQDRKNAIASAEAKLFQLGLSASEIEALLRK